MPRAHACSLAGTPSPEQFVEEAQLIVIGEVTDAGEREFQLAPEAFLKGPASAEPIRFRNTLLGCPTVEAQPGTRLLVYVFDAAEPEWPLSNGAYTLRDGKALMDGDRERTEFEVVSAIRNLTGQYAVPAATTEEGAGIDWFKTVVPLSLALAVILGIGLLLMRKWHEIDPS